MSIIGRKAKGARSGVVCEILGLVDSGVVVLADGYIIRAEYGDLILLPQTLDVPEPAGPPEPDFNARHIGCG